MDLKTINILGKQYKVKYVDNELEVDQLNKNKELIWGQIDYINKEIRILNKLSKEDKFETLLHEIAHGIYSGLFIDEPDHKDFIQIWTVLADTLVRNGFINHG